MRRGRSGGPSPLRERLIAVAFGLIGVAALAGIPAVSGRIGHLVERRAPEGPRQAERAVAEEASTFSGRVTRVVDGDTFWISAAETSIRIWGLDAPEVSDSEGGAATSALTALISNRILSCWQRDTDRYGRIVGQCLLEDGRDIAAAMIESGTAREYCHYSRNYYRTCPQR